MKKKGFTLIELIAVLVILAILALIVTPLVMSIIRKAKIAADKRSVDAYGRSIELAIAGYLMDTGDFPTSIDQLTIEYSGDQVVCETTQLNSDSSVYLAGCTVGGRSVEEYTYGKEEAPTYESYSVGDEVTYNNIDYYVIQDSNESESTVTLLKEEPITSSEISSYLSSTEISSKVYTSGTYAQMSYYSSENCVSAGDVSGCSTDYAVSDVKQLVDVWQTNYALGATTSRLATVDEISVLGYEWFDNGSAAVAWHKTESTLSWLYNNNYHYWTMSQYGDNVSSVWYVCTDGNIIGTSVSRGVHSMSGAVRPVIVLPKSALN